MLVTEYRYRQRRWAQHRQYYRFYVPETPREPGEPLPRYSCPGCGREMTAVFYNAHVCSGGARGYPRLTARDGRGRHSRKTDLEQEQRPDT